MNERIRAVSRALGGAIGVLRSVLGRGRPRDPGYGLAMPAHVKMYTRKFCGYCTGAERLLEQKGVEYEHIDTTGDHATRRWLVDQTGRTTVPQIFINGRSIGGYDELRALDRTGELDRLLAQPADKPAAPANPH